jgi:hypothetical protein
MTGYGREEAETQKRMQAAEAKLAQDVQNKLKTDKAAKDDADFAEADRVSSTARAVAGKPAAKTTSAAKSGIVTKEELEKSGLSLRDYMNKQRGLTRRDGKAPVRAGEDKKPKASGAMIQSMDTDVMRTASRTAAKADGQKRMQSAASRNKAVMSDEARKRKVGREKAFAQAQTPAAAARERTRLGDQSIKRATPELALIGGGTGVGLKTMQTAAKKLAGTSAKNTASAGAKARERIEPTFKPSKTSLSDKTKELIGSDRTAKSTELSKQMAAKQTPTKFTSKGVAASKRTKKFNEEEAGMEFKRGGKVHGSSASKRADGIAVKGKTRGKVY